MIGTLVSSLLTSAVTGFSTWWFHPANKRIRRMRGWRKEMRETNDEIDTLEAQPWTAERGDLVARLNDRVVELQGYINAALDD